MPPAASVKLQPGVSNVSAQLLQTTAKPSSSRCVALPTQAAKHEATWSRVWGVWEEVVSLVQSTSHVLQQIAGSPQCLAVQRALLSRVSDTTALRYLTTCVQFLIMVRELGWDLANLTPVQILDVVFALRFDPDSKIHATNAMKAIRWLAKTMALPWPLGYVQGF